MTDHLIILSTPLLICYYYQHVKAFMDLGGVRSSKLSVCYTTVTILHIVMSFQKNKDIMKKFEKQNIDGEVIQCGNTILTACMNRFDNLMLSSKSWLELFQKSKSI